MEALNTTTLFVLVGNCVSYSSLSFNSFKEFSFSFLFNSFIVFLDTYIYVLYMSIFQEYYELLAYVSESLFLIYFLIFIVHLF